MEQMEKVEQLEPGDIELRMSKLLIELLRPGLVDVLTSFRSRIPDLRDLEIKRLREDLKREQVKSELYRTDYLRFSALFEELKEVAEPIKTNSPRMGSDTPIGFIINELCKFRRTSNFEAEKLPNKVAELAPEDTAVPQRDLEVTEPPIGAQF